VVTCAAEVQKGDPVQERKIQRFFRNPAIARMIKRCNDFGAGGVSVAIGELAPGLLVNLDAVPLKYDGLDGTEIAISESQERMAVVVPADKTKEFIAAAAAENLDATVVAHVTEEAVLRQQWRGKTICELDRTLLDGGWAPRQAAVDMTVPADVRSYFTNMPAEITESTLADQWRENLQRLSVASQRGMQQRFDSTVGANSIVSPYGGMYQSTPSDVSVMRFPAEGATTAAITSASFDPELSTLSPFHGAMFAVIDSVARIVAAGGDPEKVRLTLQNYFGRLSDAQRWGQPFLAQLGAREAQKHLGTPAIGGKDSMSGTTKNTLDGSRIDVPPTLVSFAAGTMEESDVLPDHFQTFGSTVVQLPIILDEAGMPDWVHLKKTWQKIKELHELGSICSSRAVHAGGVAAALTKMALGNRVGFSLVPPKNPADLYVPSYGSIILELKMPDVLRSLGDIPYILLGRTQEGAAISTGRSKEDMSLPLMQLLRQWEKPLDSVFPLSPDQQGSGKNILRSSIMNKRGARPHGPSIARPRATVLTFPGTNCEMETAAAFERAGAAVRTELFVNRTRTAIKDSLKRFAEAMKDSHILAIPGGFSAGDQPDGSAKFIAAVLRNMRISDAVHEHLERGGLILGICNGFQALAKSCLLPSGHIRVQGSDDTTLVHNTNGHFLSMNSMHRVISTMSPWMSKFDHHETADFPIAHGEGRLINVSSDLWINGQVPFQYAARDGNVRDDFPSNPNGSQDAIAALTDPSGKIFGMMAHPERALPGLSMNIPTKRKGQKLFDGAISYFQ
jgi:phosphoribosylformylglycinamidine synthase